MFISTAGSRIHTIKHCVVIMCAFVLALATARLSRADVDGSAIGIHSGPISSATASRDASAGLANRAVDPHDQPFGVRVAAVSDNGLEQKWADMRRAIASEGDILARCRTEACPAAASRFLAIVAKASSRSGRARLGEVNRAVNLAIRPISDLAQYGVADRWAPPLDALARGAGDCEDYAIAKYAALRAAGIGEDDLRLLIVRDVRSREDHAVLTARLDGRWLVLDNRRLLLLEDSQLPDYVPLFLIGVDGVRRVDGRSRYAEAAARRN